MILKALAEKYEIFKLWQISKQYQEEIPKLYVICVPIYN